MKVGGRKVSKEWVSMIFGRKAGRGRKNEKLETSEERRKKYSGVPDAGEVGKYFDRKHQSSSIDGVLLLLQSI
jgi:hypothetical protein